MPPNKLATIGLFHQSAACYGLPRGRPAQCARTNGPARLGYGHGRWRRLPVEFTRGLRAFQTMYRSPPHTAYIQPLPQMSAVPCGTRTGTAESPGEWRPDDAGSAGACCLVRSTSPSSSGAMGTNLQTNAIDSGQGSSAGSAIALRADAHPLSTSAADAIASTPMSVIRSTPARFRFADSAGRPPPHSSFI
jgi:hypothetical protein